MSCFLSRHAKGTTSCMTVKLRELTSAKVTRSVAGVGAPTEQRELFSRKGPGAGKSDGSCTGRRDTKA
eukprot:611911-Pleurochrysis_carterae.AAC.1